MAFGIKKNIVDKCIYLKVSGSKVIVLVLYVDDTLLATNDLDLLYETKKFLSNNFEIKDMDDTSYVIGIEIFVIDRKNCYACIRNHLSINFKKFEMDNSTYIVPIHKGGKKKVLKYFQGIKDHMLAYGRYNYLYVIGYSYSN